MFSTAVRNERRAPPSLGPAGGGPRGGRARPPPVAPAGGEGAARRLEGGRRALWRLSPPRGGPAPAAVHVPAGAHVPLQAAGLPVLQSLDVRQDVRAGQRVESGLDEERGQFGERGVLELLEARGAQVVDGFGGLLRCAVQEGLQDEYAV